MCILSVHIQKKTHAMIMQRIDTLQDTLETFMHTSNRTQTQLLQLMRCGPQVPHMCQTSPTYMKINLQKKCTDFLSQFRWKEELVAAEKHFNLGEMGKPTSGRKMSGGKDA